MPTRYRVLGFRSSAARMTTCATWSTVLICRTTAALAKYARIRSAIRWYGPVPDASDSRSIAVSCHPVST